MAGDAIATRAENVQTLDARLSSIASVLATIARGPVAPTRVSPADAVGAIAVRDVKAQHAVPPQDVALIDGRAVASSDLVGASPLSPAFAAAEPPYVRVGEPVPAGCDSVIDAALVLGAGAAFEIHGATAPGEGVRRAGEDFRSAETILRAGDRITALHALALAAAGVSEVELRHPRVRLVAVTAAQTARFIEALAWEDGVAVETVKAQDRTAGAIANALAGEWDAALIVGGSGVSENDHSVHAMRACGEVVAHGLALDPGRTGAAGLMEDRPAVCLPGRFESALSVYLALARPMLLRLCGANAPAQASEAPLARKIASAVGLSQLALLQFLDGRWAPLCVGDVTLSCLIRADAYIVIPDGSEGFAEGAMVEPLRLPGRR